VPWRNAGCVLVGSSAGSRNRISKSIVDKCNTNEQKHVFNSNEAAAVNGLHVLWLEHILAFLRCFPPPPTPTIHIMASIPKPSKAELESAPSTPIVSFLGPVSSYTHQVFTLCQFQRPPWSIGLTDYDLAQAALSCLDADRYNYDPAGSITGNSFT
jgi:hypothetical protein